MKKFRLNQVGQCMNFTPMGIADLDSNYFFLPQHFSLIWLDKVIMKTYGTIFTQNEDMNTISSAVEEYKFFEKLETQFCYFCPSRVFKQVYDSQI